MKFSKEYITLAIPFLIIGLILIIILPNELKFLGIIVGLLFQFFYSYKQKKHKKKGNKKHPQ
ncbi:hypothetical protein [Mammaliicoccus lentus]|jgi:4-hydroxybenzoate polyprenyltransferase|uniref:hypothetical protein n=1 Tax=Mammaliicoccus lentus TaxID=42858 RepID=UPI0010727EA0|nr:hypothetical protein [Mammaliicoccus lentus]MBF0795847.1 hypothetical protein [Mammaliicoccus lentus]MBF0795852.1 hypothetical protein [Mammaliicoccus lentus]TFV13515.1 hypothetical protein E4T78_14630 [Mammaliicoccus lentus]TFV13519.1 hypothetical protein E4T78_14650 [Mammaliicoccus lentus]